MDRRTQANLVYQLCSNLVGLTLVLCVFVLLTLPDMTILSLARDFFIYLVAAIFLLMTWWRLGGMSTVGIFWRKPNAILSMVFILDILLLPVALRFIISGSTEVQAIGMITMTASFGLIDALMAIMIHLSPVYQSKSKWRLVHHSLWVSSGLFFISMLIPFSMTTVVDIPVRVLSWILIFAIPPIIRKMGVNLVATPAKPPDQSQAREGSSSQNQRTQTQSENSRSSSSESSQHRRRPRRGQYRRQSGGSRRRM